jgi:hypothetical protein
MIRTEAITVRDPRHNRKTYVLRSPYLWLTSVFRPFATQIPIHGWESTRGVASIQNTKKISIPAHRLTDWQHAARPGPTFRGEIGRDAGDFLNNKRGLLAALVLRDKRDLFKVG